MTHQEAAPIYSISMLNTEANALLQTHFESILVMGEISNLSRPSSGHLYFSLKDDQAQIRCALFRFQHHQVNFQIENGQQVVVRARVSVYEPRGDFQLIVSAIQLAGAGELQLAFEQLKKKLEKAGLFDEKHKKSLPLFPKKIGIITSTSAAALQDVLKVLHKRAPHIPIVIYPTMVQGDQAAEHIVHAIALANQHAECDILILTRGGGSIEDLWCFNAESVALAIFRSSIPLITGIGHQTDFTIADFVADVRAPTPSAAAEIVAPDQAELRDTLLHWYQRLYRHIQHKIDLRKTELLHLTKRLQHPGEKIQQQAQQLDQIESQLLQQMRFYMQNKREKIAHLAQLLDTLSPLKILHRGFSITREKTSGKIITDSTQVQSGDCIITRIYQGEIESQVR